MQICVNITQKAYFVKKRKESRTDFSQRKSQDFQYYLTD